MFRTAKSELKMVDGTKVNVYEINGSTATEIIWTDGEEMLVQELTHSEMVKDIKGFEGLYVVVDDGRVYSLISNKYLKPDINGQVSLRKDGKAYKKLVYRIVAEHFLGFYREEFDVHHIDHDKENNHVDNLVCISKKMHEHIHRHSEITKSRKSEAMRGENHPLYGKHLSEETKRKMSEAMNERKRAIIQRTKDTLDFVERFESRSEASRKTKIDAGNISNCCYEKRKSAGGYVWEFERIKVE